MATSFNPANVGAGQDNFAAIVTGGAGTNMNAADAQGRTHAQNHTDLGDGLEAAQTGLVTAAGGELSVAARLTAIEAGTRLGTGSVTSTKILDGTILDIDVNASAAIAATKISGTAATLNAANVFIAKQRVEAGLTVAYAAKTSTYTLTGNDQIVDCTSGTFTVTLPTAASATGQLYVVNNSGSGTVTIGRTSSQTIDGVAADVVLAGKGIFELVSDGAGWKVLRGQYTSETVGRRLFSWSHALGGWQLTYGDTGWRTCGEWDAAGTFTGGLLVSAFGAPAIAGAAGQWQMRRINNVIYHRFSGVTFSSGASGYIFGNTSYMPTGFLIAWYEQFSIPGVLRTIGFAIDFAYLYLDNTVTAGAQKWFGFSYSAANAWPASLPGAAYGSIPSA